MIKKYIIEKLIKYRFILKNIKNKIWPHIKK